MSLQIDATSNWVLFESRLKGSVKEGKKIALVNSQNNESKWFLIDSSLYHPQLQGKKLWDSLGPKASSIKTTLKLVLGEKNKINILEIAGSPLISEIIRKEKSKSKREYVIVGIFNQFSPDFHEIYEISSFLKRKCSFTEIKANFYFIIFRKVVSSYFVLEVGNIKKVAEIFEDLLIGNYRNITFTSFSNPSLELSRAIVGEPPHYYSKVCLESRLQKFVDSIKKTVKDEPSPFIYTIK